MAANFGQTPMTSNNQVFIVCNQPQGLQRKGYTNESSSTVLGLSITQLILGFTCLTSQIISISIAERASWWFRDSEYNGTGIWVGLIIITAASVGIAGCKQNKTSLIITHLVFNVLLLMLPIVLMTISSISVSILRDDWSLEKHEKALLAFAVIQVIASCLTFIISLTLLIYNSIAVRCCLCCCDRYAGQVIAYSVPSNMVYPAQVAYHTGGTQQPVMYPMQQNITTIPHVPLSYAPNQPVAIPGVSMPPSYVAQTSDFHPPPKY